MLEDNSAAFVADWRMWHNEMSLCRWVVFVSSYDKPAVVCGGQVGGGRSVVCAASCGHCWEVQVTSLLVWAVAELYEEVGWQLGKHTSADAGIILFPHLLWTERQNLSTQSC